MTRSRERDGWKNQLQFAVLTNFEPVWEFLHSRPRLRRLTNHALINSAVLTMPTRPNPLSTLADYTSWSSLTDRTYSGRHLPPVAARDLPDAERVADLFTRSGDGDAVPEVDGACSPTSRSGSRTASCARTATPSATRAATTRATRSTCCRSTA